MLDIALQFLVDELNTCLTTKTGSDSVRVAMDKVVEHDGKYAFAAESLCASIINIEEDRIFKEHLPEYATINNQHVVLEPELRLNLYILIAANFKHYDQALKYISYVLTFFQAHPLFTSDEYPALTPTIGRLTMELQSLSFEQLNQVWAFVGGKQLPSVIYKVRMVALQDKAQAAIQPPLTTISTSIHGR
ncbi:MAG: hypothetical protein A2521_05100 [Deltaproteobacteria bacterium RIFOXYD12_FULL_57_12]|nr:MAG: hypothetical protein A2521_05100 [Deltaproteobacteria bacterium RIFOXYD12_FULL_57_12]